MITKLLNEVNKNIETLNNLVQDKEYFEKLDERIEKVNNYVQVQKQEIERLNNIIKEVREYIENEMVLEFYNDKTPLEVLIHKCLEILEGGKDTKL